MRLAARRSFIASSSGPLPTNTRCALGSARFSSAGMRRATARYPSPEISFAGVQDHVVVASMPQLCARQAKRTTLMDAVTVCEPPCIDRMRCEERFARRRTPKCAKYSRLLLPTAMGTSTFRYTVFRTSLRAKRA